MLAWYAYRGERLGVGGQEGMLAAGCDELEAVLQHPADLHEQVPLPMLLLPVLLARPPCQI